MRTFLKQAALVAACITALPANATNGYFLPGFGTRSQGMGGVGIAYGRDSLSTAANPANAVNTGMRGDMGFAVFNPERHAEVHDDPLNTTPGFFSGNVESDAKYFIMPEMGFSMPLSETVHVALAVVGNGGMNTTYRTNFFSFFTNPPADTTVGVDMVQLLVPISLAYKVNENHALGVSLVLAETRFRAYGIDAFKPFNISADNAHLTGLGFDYSYGAGFKVGWLGEFMDDKLTVGLTYASRTYMTKLDKYRGLFAEQGDFDIPENYGIGIAIKPVKNLVIAADILRINYHDIASVGNPGPGANPDGFGPLGGIPALDAGVLCPNNPYCLGNDRGMGFGWNNMTVYKLGVQYGVNNKLQVRAGYNYGKSPIPNNQVTFNLLAPATVEDHYSVGFTYKPNDVLEVTGTYMYVASHSQSACGQNIVDCASFNMHQNVFGLSLGWMLEPGPHTLEEYGDTDWKGVNFDNWYAGFGFGQSRYRNPVPSAVTANTRTEGWKVYTGYQFNKYLGAEGGYANLNDMTAHTSTAIVNTHSNAWTLAAVGAYPLTDKFSVMAKLGAAYVLTSTNTKVGAALSKRTGDDSYQPYYGVGVKYALLDNVDLRAEWERFDLDHYNIDLMTAGFAVKF
jgi:long-chain fatty acid transport protein